MLSHNQITFYYVPRRSEKNNKKQSPWPWIHRGDCLSLIPNWKIKIWREEKISYFPNNECIDAFGILKALRGMPWTAQHPNIVVATRFFLSFSLHRLAHQTWIQNRNNTCVHWCAMCVRALWIWIAWMDHENERVRERNLRRSWWMNGYH